MMIINPGSHVEGGTFEQAQENAAEWHRIMEREGISDVEVLVSSAEPIDGRWSFCFRHRLTGISQELRVHGYSDEECKRDFIFWPRSYWKGSSSSTPELADFVAPGFRIAIVQDNAETAVPRNVAVKEPA